jgi:hypothetical protein
MLQQVPLRDDRYARVAKMTGDGSGLCMRTSLFALIVLLHASPAYAWAGIQIPEPSNVALFGLGLTGLIIGRQIAKRKTPTKDD